GNSVTVDNSDGAMTTRYFRQNAQFSAMHRKEYDQSNNGSGDISLNLASGGGSRFSGLLASDDPLDANGNHTGSGQGQVFTSQLTSVMGAHRLLITGATGIYESLNKGDTISLLQTQNLGPVVSAVYGGRFNGLDNPDVAYIECQNGILLRTTAG